MPKDARNNELDGASPGKIFIGGLPRDTTMPVFLKHFGKYGDIIDSVIMKDRHTQQPRGFGFITYENPAVVDNVMEDTHVINGKTVEIKRTIPKGAAQNNRDFKTKKIFVGGIPADVTEEDLKSFFSKYGEVVQHEIIRDHMTKRSRGFGFVIFESEHSVDELLSNGNMIDFSGHQVEIKKAEPKKSANPPPFASEPRGRSFGRGIGGYGSNSFNSPADFGPSEYDSSYRTSSLGPSRFNDYGGGYANDYGSGGYGGSGYGLGGYNRGEPSFGSYSSRYGGGGYGNGGSGYGGGGYGGGYGGYGREEFGGGYGGPGYGNGGGGYDSGPGSSYGGRGFYGGRSGGGGGGGGYGGGGSGPSGRYHPYGR